MLKKFGLLTALGLSVFCHQGFSAQIASYEYHTLILSDTEVWGWGRNQHGQLGNNLISTNATWVQATNTINFNSVAAGDFFSLGLSNGIVYAWGNNSSGQLGNGTSPGGSLIAKPVPGLSSVSHIAAGEQQALAIKTDGTLWTWGMNVHGEMGQGTIGGSSNSPVQVSLVDDVVDVVGGKQFSVAALADGTVWAWGTGTDGRLGNNGTASSSVPVQVSSLAGVIDVAAGDAFGLALKSDGTVWAWGFNREGQLGDGTFTTRLTPVRCGTLSNVVAICAGGEHSMALHSDGQVSTWGSGQYGQLGDGYHDYGGRKIPTPATIPGVSNVVEIAAGQYHSVLLIPAGENDLEVLTFGHQHYGQLGNGQFDFQNFAATNGVQNIAQISGGAKHMLVLSSNGTVQAWGDNNRGPLGNNDQDDHEGYPVNVFDLTNITAIAGGEERSLALSNNVVYTWGANVERPQRLGNLTNISAIAAGTVHNLAISNGIVVGWGSSAGGQLGWGYATSPLPAGRVVQAVGLSGVTHIAAGKDHSVAVSGGYVWAWGSQVNGRLGNNVDSSDPQLTPVQIANLQNVTAISANRDHTLAISNGCVVAWGQNSDSGHLGNGSTAHSLVPTLVTDHVLVGSPGTELEFAL